MIRMSMLRNHPVVLGHKRLGLLQTFCVDHAQKRVYALIISRGFLGKCIVLPEHILAIDSRFILISSYCRYKRSFEQTRSQFVRDSSGLLVGCIADYAVDEADLSIIAIRIQTGYLFSQRRERLWVYDYACTNPDKPGIGISACMGSELIM